MNKIGVWVGPKGMPDESDAIMDTSAADRGALEFFARESTAWQLGRGAKLVLDPRAWGHVQNHCALVGVGFPAYALR